MKFNDGYWRLRPGVHAEYARTVHRVDAADRELTVRAATRPVSGPGDTVGVPSISVRYFSPMAGVIGVEVSRYSGGRTRSPQFTLSADPAVDAQVDVGPASATLTSGDLSVHVQLGDRWQVDFTAGGDLLTSSGGKSLGSIRCDDGSAFVHERLALDVGELVYGLGERFTSFVRNGQVVDIWNQDGGTSSEQAYKNVPFYLTNRGYGVFVDTPGPVSFEVGSEVVSAVQFSTPGHVLRYYVIAGPTPAEVLTRFTALTGRPTRPPAWSFGLWLSTSFLTDWDADTVRSFVTGMAEHDIPLSVVHLDSFWMRPFHFCDFEWDRSRIPDPAALLAELHEAGVRVCAWINPYLGQESPVFEEARTRGYLLRRPDGDLWQWDVWQSGMGIVDLTNEDARAWWADKLRALVDLGVDCFKTDFGELIPTDVVWADGSDPQLMHNYYSYLYNETVFNVLRERRGEGEAVLFARSATAGGQQFPVHWGGDPEPSYVSMAETLRGGLSLGLSGFGFWSHDIGGFEGTPSPAVFKRWVPFGLLSSHSRLHGSISYRVPWEFDEEAVEVLRRFTRLKMRLMPYIWSAAEEAATRGLPVLRAMVLEFPEDPTCAHLDRQFMLGADILVAPAFCDDGRVDYYLPAGDWTQLITGEVVRGGTWRRETHDFLSLPVFVRPGTVVPTGPESGLPERDHRDDLTLEWYAPVEGARDVAVPGPRPEDAPASFTLRRNGRHLSVQARNATNWRVALRGVRHVTVEGDVSVRTTPHGVVLTPAAGADRLDAYVVGRHA